MPDETKVVEVAPAVTVAKVASVAKTAAPLGVGSVTVPVAPAHEIDAAPLIAKLEPLSRFPGYPRVAEGRPDVLEVSPQSYVDRKILETPCAVCGDNYLEHPKPDCLHYRLSLDEIEATDIDPTRVVEV